MAVRLGIDVFLDQWRDFRSKKLALVTNHAATTSAYTPSRQALQTAGFRLVRLFSPEHGLETVGADGRFMPNGTDPLTGLPVISLYGDQLRPAAGDLADLDAVVVDLPDVGCRFYTYLWTLTYVMEACAEHQKPLLLLDRPNPLSGTLARAEGPMLDESRCASFIGRWSIPVRHSCTFGELARFWQHQRLPTLDLTVIRVEGWKRSRFQADWQPSFVPTSPAMVSREAALLYPGLGLLEATNLSEGRGTALPFRVAGAPWLEATTLVARFNALQVPGVVARALIFTPQEGKYANQLCRGVQFHVCDAARVRPVFSAMAFIKLVRDHHPETFGWRPYPTLINPTGEQHLDKLLGIWQAESLFEEPLDAFLKTARAVLFPEAWATTIRPFLGY
ncbi:exo-beta-N-acetylmuramidase NamZ domain-containing protein [Larkinella bovis]|uniref:Exo-beta-N-acetylmuramidase NamZ domain-containing protein n=1 Tax=Larkinella bovis TaxID=683041 RepID=A0ABW0IJ04_9BACT